MKKLFVFAIIIASTLSLEAEEHYDEFIFDKTLPSLKDMGVIHVSIRKHVDVVRTRKQCCYTTNRGIAMDCEGRRWIL